MRTIKANIVQDKDVEEDNPRCMWYRISRNHQQREMNRGAGHFGTRHYGNVGCFDCSGDNIQCNYYQERGK